MVISTGLFRALKNRYPSLRIGVVASRGNAVVLRACPFVDRVFVYDKRPLETLRLLSRVRSETYDIVVNLVLYSSLTGGILSALCGPRAFRVRMTQGDDKDFFYHLNVRKKVWGAAAASMLQETLSLLPELGVTVAPDEAQPFMAVPEGTRAASRGWAEREPAGLKIGVNLAAGVVDREVSASTWHAFLVLLRRALPQAGIYLFFPANCRIRRELMQLGLPAGVRDIPPHGNVLEAAAYLLEMDLMVSPDTSLVHICSAVGKPVVGVYKGEENALLWGPVGVDHEKVIGLAGIDSVVPEAILEAVRRLAARLR